MMLVSKHFFRLFPFALLSALIGCGSDSSASAGEESSSSESSSSVEPSSSYSNRLDVAYADSLTNDTLKITQGDSLRTSYKLFLGEYSKGTLIRIIGKKSGGHADSLFVREEQGTILIPELVGRLPVVVSLEELDANALKRILTEPKNAIVKQYVKLFKMDGIELSFTDDGISEIVNFTMERKTGARGLRSVVERTLQKAMYELPGSKTKKLVVDATLVKKALSQGDKKNVA